MDPPVDKHSSSRRGPCGAERFAAIITAMMLAEGVILNGYYRLRQMLGRGGMGPVWEAEHTRLPKRFAVKLLLGLSHVEPKLLMRFRREAEIASRLNHRASFR